MRKAKRKNNSNQATDKIAKLYYFIRFHLHNAISYGCNYEAFRILKKIGLVKEIPIRYVLKRQELLLNNPWMQMKELRYRYSAVVGREVEIENPKSFNEKIQWLKVHQTSKIKTDLSDKYLVREWIENKIGNKYLIPLLGVWENFDDIDFDILPSAFVLKCNHGSGMNIVVKDKERLDGEAMQVYRKKFEDWMNLNFSAESIELQYKDIKPQIIAEAYIEEMDGNLYDYKIHCFNGEPRFIQVIGDRDLARHTGHQYHYDLDWKLLSWTFEDYPRFKRELKKPPKLGEMGEVAKMLCKDFEYVRVDLYEVGERILFGEMTFTPNSGFYKYQGSWTRERDLSLGELLRITETV